MLLYHTYVQPLTLLYRRQIIDFIEMCSSKIEMNNSKLLDNNTVVLMQRNSKIIGVCLLKYETPDGVDFDWEPPYWLITALCVQPSERRTGKATEILDYVFQEICTNKTECRVHLDSTSGFDKSEVSFMKDFFKMRKIKVTPE